MLLAPIWSVAFPPLLDYPNHLARSFVLAHLHDPAFTFSRFFRADWGAYPYLGMDASLAVLGRLFPIETAGRVFLSLCALALPAAAWFFLRQVNPGEDATAAVGAADCVQCIFPRRIFEFRPEPRRGISGARTLAALAREAGVSRGGSRRSWRSPRCISRTCWDSASRDWSWWHISRFHRRPLRDWIWSGALALPGLAFYLHSSRVGLERE